MLDYIREKQPTFLFIQMDSVDGAGHGSGYGFPAFIERIHEVDKLIGDVHYAAEEAKIQK